MTTKSCDLNCANGGYCSLYPFESSLVTSTPLDGSLHQLCVCPLGYTGLTCSEPTEELESCHEHDGTNVCRHGGLCRDIGTSSNQSKWVCDCSFADKVNAFAGAMCRQPATEYCNMSGSSFCTNGGTCISNLVHLEFAVHGECICPPEFTGPHCEFLKVLVEKQYKPHSVLESGDVKPRDNGRPDRNNHVPISLGLLSITTLAFSIWWKKRNKSNHEQNNVAPSRRMNHSNPVFPVHCSPGYSDDIFYQNDDGESDDDCSFHDVTLT